MASEPRSSEPTSSPALPWPAVLAALACLAVFVLSLLEKLAPLSLRLDLASPVLSLALAFVALAPLAFYTLTLERGKAAPALRHPLAPWVLLACLHLGVQLSGGVVSPLWAAYPLLTLAIARHAGLGAALGPALLMTVLEGFPLWAQSHLSGASPWPHALALGLPWAGLLLGRTAGEPVASGPAAAPRPRSETPPAASAVLGEEDGAPSQGWEALGQGLDAATLLARDLDATLNLGFNSHPGLNSLSLWWGDEAGVDLRGLRLRRGQGVEAAHVAAGEGHLGLVLRERRTLGIEPLAASAAAGLPWARGPYVAQALRVLPLTDEGRLVGLLAADKADEPGFSPEEAAALEALGRLMVQHAQRAAHLARLQTAGGRTQRLYAATQALAAEMDRDALLRRFGGLLATLVPADSWALGMREEDGGPLLRVAGHGYEDGAALDMSLDRSSALANTLSQAEGAVLFNRAQGAQVPAVLQEGLEGSAQHFLLAPLRLGGKLSGVLKLDRRDAPFGEADRDIAFIFASQAAVTLEHARLYSLHLRHATTDGLTGLYNHRYFQERLAAELAAAQRGGGTLTVALTDIDFFKKFNDTFGHQEGDVVLRKVAKLAQDMVRPQDIVCRYGGEEFVVILPGCDVVEARQVLDAYRGHSAEHLIGGSGPEARPITISVGLATYPQCGREPRELIHAADEALYHAKHTGRDRVCSWKDLPAKA